MKHGRPRGPLGFQALVALHSAGDVVDGFALFPDQLHAVDAAIALVEEGQIVQCSHRRAVSEYDFVAPSRTLSTGRNCAPAAATVVTPTSPTKHGGHEPAPPLMLHAHPLVLPTRWLLSSCPPRYSV